MSASVTTEPRGRETTASSPEAPWRLEGAAAVLLQLVDGGVGPTNIAALTTAGGLMFTGEGDGWFRAYDPATGKYGAIAMGSVRAGGVLTGKYRAGEEVPAGTRAASRDMSRFIGQWLTRPVVSV